MDFPTKLCLVRTFVSRPNDVWSRKRFREQKSGHDMNVATKVFRTKMSQTSVISHHPETIFGIEMIFFSLFCTNIQQKFVTLPQNYERWQNFLNVVPRFGTTILYLRHRI